MSGAVDGDVLAEVLSGVEAGVAAGGHGVGGGGGGRSLQAHRRRSTHGLPSMQRSQFGTQVDSGKHNSPAYGFGTSVRFDFQKDRKLRMSADMSAGPVEVTRLRRKAPAYHVPGPGYYKSASAIGRQEYSERRTYPSFGFGTADRFAQDAREQKQLLGYPAPGTYPLPDSVGPQPASTKETVPVISFGTAGRDVKVSIGRGYEEDLKGLDTPGPAVYNPGSGTGPAQLMSGMGSASRFSFGTDMRATDPAKKNHDEQRAAAVPGPGYYVLPKSIGVQAQSTKASMPSYGFGTCYRDQASKSSLGPLQAMSQLAGYLSPGPAALGAGPSAYGPQPHSGKVTKPEVSFGRELRFNGKNPAALVPGPGSYCN